MPSTNDCLPWSSPGHLRTDTCCQREGRSRKADLWNSKVAEDEEYELRSVTIFKKVKEDFAQKCRENRSATS